LHYFSSIELHNLVRIISENTQAGSRLHTCENSSFVTFERHSQRHSYRIPTSADYISLCLHARLHITERRISLLLLLRRCRSSAVQWPSFSPNLGRFFVTCIHRKILCVSLQNCEKVMSAVKTTDISFQHTCSLLLEKLHRGEKRRSQWSLTWNVPQKWRFRREMSKQNVDSIDKIFIKFYKSNLKIFLNKKKQLIVNLVKIKFIFASNFRIK